jgi:hypothetical protein
MGPVLDGCWTGAVWSNWEAVFPRRFRRSVSCTLSVGRIVGLRLTGSLVRGGSPSSVVR